MLEGQSIGSAMESQLEPVAEDTYLDKYAKLQVVLTVMWPVVRTVMLASLVFTLLYPLIGMISTALKSPQDLADAVSVWIPRNPNLQNFVAAFHGLDYLSSLTNSAVISTVSSLAHVATCSLTGYAFAKFEFRGKSLLFGLLLLSLIVPPQTIIVSLFINMRDVDLFGIVGFIRGLTGGSGGISLLNSKGVFIGPALFGVGLRSGLLIYLYRQFFRGMPRELQEAAYIDGAGPFSTYLKVMLPNSLPVSITVFLFSFVWHWNDIYLARAFLRTTRQLTLTVRYTGLYTYLWGYKDGMYVPYGNMNLAYAAAMLLIILPLLILYLVCQRFFIQGVERSGIVG